MATSPPVAIRQLRRVYERKGQPPRVALEGLDLLLSPGEVHGLLGPNGAGKTTLCKILSTVLVPTSGTAEIFGYNVASQARAVRPLIGIVFGGERGLYTRLTARQNLIYWSALYRQTGGAGRRRADALLDRVGLSDRAGERVETFSRGMKQRLHLARGLIGDPKVVILDEPTTGMDPVAAREFRALVGELREEGRTCLLTTHDMAEAEAICDRVSLIDEGKLLATQDPATIGQLLTSYLRILAESVPEWVAGELQNLPGVISVTSDKSNLIVEVGAAEAANQVLQTLVSAGVTAVATGRPSLEDVYLHLIGNRGLTIR